jgi:hypothetical protein
MDTSEDERFLCSLQNNSVALFAVFTFAGGVEPKKKFIKSKTRPTSGQQKEQTRLQLAN